MNLYADPEEENIVDKLRERLIHEELLNMQALLKSRITQERNEIKRLMEMLTERGTAEKKKPAERIHSPNEAEMTAMIQLVKENQLLEVYIFLFFNLHRTCAFYLCDFFLGVEKYFLLLQKKMTTLIRSIIEEKDACVELRVQLAVHQLMTKT